MRQLSSIILCTGLLGCGNGPDEPAPPGDTDPPTTTSTTSAGVPATLLQGGEIPCANPSGRNAAEFNKKTSPAPPNSEIWLWGGGNLAADLDEDGFLEVLLTHETPEADLYSTLAGDGFEMRPDALAGFDLSYGTGGSAADYDGDGDLDLYLTRYNRPNVLLRNDGTLQFTDVTQQAGVASCHPRTIAESVDPGAHDWEYDINPMVDCYRSMSTSWGDLDRDGDLDLVVGNYGWVNHSGEPASTFGPAEPSFLYMNNGDGTFTDATEDQMPWPEVHDGYTYVSSILDLDGDGWSEIYLINDFGTAYPNALIRNDEGVLSLDNNAMGLDKTMTGMGLGIGDLNADGLPDMLIPEWDGIRMLQSQPAYGLWAEVATPSVGISPSGPQKVPWGGEIADMDLDGDLDAIIAYGFVSSTNPIWDNSFAQPDSLYLQQADGSFVENAYLWGVADAGVGRGFVTADLNRDGYLDLAKRDLGGADVLFLSVCGAGNWLSVSLRQPGTMNTHAIGAVVDIEATGHHQRRWLMAGGVNYNSSPPPEVHFGLGISEVVQKLTVTWPDGEVSVFDDIAGRQHLTISRD